VDHAVWTTDSLLTLSRRTQPPPETPSFPLPAERTGTAVVINLSSAAPAAVAPLPTAAPEVGHTTPTPSVVFLPEYYLAEAPVTHALYVCHARVPGGVIPLIN